LVEDQQDVTMLSIA